jgi:hypothetical protein
MEEISNIIDTNTLLDMPNSNEFMCLFDSCILEKYTEQWKYNRTLNPDKVEEIKNSITGKMLINTILHLFHCIENGIEKLICYDGNHRRSALISLFNENGINMKVICHIHKNIRPENIENEIAFNFNQINQNSPIPDMYLDIVNNLANPEITELLVAKKDIIETVFEEYKIRYKSCYVKSAKPRRPNFNDTKFKDLCNRYAFKTSLELKQQLEQLNAYNKAKDNTGISENITNKCNISNCYFFI